MPQKKSVNILTAFALAAVSLIALWFFIRYLLPWLSPFIFAFMTAGLIEPAVSFLNKKVRLPHVLASIICCLTFLLSLAGIFVFAGFKAFTEVSSFISELPDLLSIFGSITSEIETGIDSFISGVPEELRSILLGAVSGISSWSSSLPGTLSTKLFSAVSDFISGAPKTVFFVITYVMAVFFTSSSYGKIKAFILRQVPLRLQNTAREIKDSVVLTFERWLLSYLALMGITFLELSIAFTILGVDYAVLLAFFTALIDALPVLGTGTVLLPWALWTLLSGNAGRAIALAAIYCIVTTVHSFLEPKIVGSKAGLSSIATLLAIYIGFNCAGVAGMVLFPLALIILKLFNDNGYVRLWRE